MTGPNYHTTSESAMALQRAAVLICEAKRLLLAERRHTHNRANFMTLELLAKVAGKLVCAIDRLERSLGSVRRYPAIEEAGKTAA